MKKFYNEDSSAAMGLRVVPKHKYEHLHISSFSAMRVDLAAHVQVRVCNLPCIMKIDFSEYF